VLFALCRPPDRSQEIQEDHQVDEPDLVEEEDGHQGAGDLADAAPLRQVFLDVGRRECQGRAQHLDDRGMAQ
jgi:hypothetical protein